MQNIRKKRYLFWPVSGKANSFRSIISHLLAALVVSQVVGCSSDDNKNRDTTPPEVTLLGLETLTIPKDSEYLEPGAFAIDDVDGEVPVTTTGNVDSKQTGSYQLTYSATDKAGNTGQAVRSVIVEADTTPPEITLLGDNPMELKKGETYSEPGATAMDNVDGEVAVSIQGAVDTNQVGTYLVTYRASDNAGNASSVSRTVKVIDDSLEACTRPPIPRLIDAPFEIIVPDAEIATGEPVNFSLSPDEGVDLANYQISWFVDDPDGQEPTITGQQGSYTYDYPGRFRIIATVTHITNTEDSRQLINYVNVYRPFEQTSYATNHFDPLKNKRIGDPGSGQYCHYDYDVFYGKYYELWLQKDHPNPPTKAILQEALAHGDFLHEKYSEMFGWDLRTKNRAQRIVLCGDVQGAGGGSGGMFDNTIRTNPDTGGVSADFWWVMLHEFMHQWDMRGGIHMSGPEHAHALTSSQEYLAYTLTDTPRLVQGRRFIPVSPEFNDLHIERIMYHRYLNDENFDWSSLYNDEIMDMEYGTHPLPENKEYMQIMGGVLMAFYRMHGPEGLRAYYQQIDVFLLENPEWNRGISTVELSNEQRTENMLLAMARAVRFDVSDYYDAWKFPVSEAMRTRLSQYPKSPMITDFDQDGYSRLQGDINDCDSTVFPGSQELADSKDNNANGLIDETVIDERISGDVTEVSSELPLVIKGKIADLNDIDVYRFTVPEGKRALVTTLTLGASSRVPLSDTGKEAGRPNKLFSGSYSIDGHGKRGSIYAWSHLPTANFIIDGDGTEKTIRVDASTVQGMNPNPGNYEITVQVSEATNRDMSTNALLEFLYGDERDTGNDETKVILLAGQSNMEGGVDRPLFAKLLQEVSILSEDREQRLVSAFEQWYLEENDGYASYGYSEQMAIFQAQEMMRFYDQGTIGDHLLTPLNNVYCTFNAIGPIALQPGCGYPFGPELLLGHQASKATDKPTALVKVAYGGTDLANDWRSASIVAEHGGVEGPHYQDLVARIDSLAQNPETVMSECLSKICQWNALVWFQGESDGFLEAGANYERNLRLFLKDVREKTRPDLPIVIIQIGEWAKGIRPMGQTVYNAQEAVANSLANTALVKTDDLSGYYHYDPAAQLIIGYRVAEALETLGVF